MRELCKENQNENPDENNRKPKQSLLDEIRQLCVDDSEGNNNKETQEQLFSFNLKDEKKLSLLNKFNIIFIILICR